MKALVHIPALVLVSSLASPALANENFGWSFGVDATSNYIWAGETQSDGEFAIQPWVELTYGGAYLTLWASQIDFGDDDNWETDIFVGYRGDLEGGLSYDVGLARYAYDVSGYSGSEATLALSYQFNDAFSGTAFFAYDWEDDLTQTYVAASYEVIDNLSLGGKIGSAQSTDSDYYYSIGASYSVNDNFSFNAAYHGIEGEYKDSGERMDDQGFVFTASAYF